MHETRYQHVLRSQSPVTCVRDATPSPIPPLPPDRYVCVIAVALNGPSCRVCAGAQLKKLLTAEFDNEILPPTKRTMLEDFVALRERRERLRRVEAELVLEEASDGGSSSCDASVVSERELHQWREQGGLPESVLNGIDSLHALRSKRAQGRRKKAALADRIKEVFNNQNRLRENIRSFEKIGKNELLDRYLKDMGTEEDELIATRAAIAQLDEDAGRLASEMSVAHLLLSRDVEKLKGQLEGGMMEELPAGSA